LSVGLLILVRVHWLNQWPDMVGVDDPVALHGAYKVVDGQLPLALHFHCFSTWASTRRRAPADWHEIAEILHDGYRHVAAPEPRQVS
jgi:hypothetical protein